MNRARRHRRSKFPGYAQYQISPFAATRTEGPMRALQLFSTCFEMIRTGFRPDTEEPFAWYDRAIRVMGAIMILATFAAGLILLAIEAFQK